MRRRRWIFGQAIVAWVVACATSIAGAAPNGPAEKSLDRCQQIVRSEGLKYVQSVHKAIATCLDKVADEILKKNASTVAAVRSAPLSSTRSVAATERASAISWWTSWRRSASRHRRTHIRSATSSARGLRPLRSHCTFSGSAPSAGRSGAMARSIRPPSGGSASGARTTAPCTPRSPWNFLARSKGSLSSQPQCLPRMPGPPCSRWKQRSTGRATTDVPICSVAHLRRRNQVGHRAMRRRRPRRRHVREHRLRDGSLACDPTTCGFDSGGCSSAPTGIGFPATGQTTCWVGSRSDRFPVSGRVRTASSAPERPWPMSTTATEPLPTSIPG